MDSHLLGTPYSKIIKCALRIQRNLKKTSREFFKGHTAFISNCYALAKECMDGLALLETPVSFFKMITRPHVVIRQECHIFSFSFSRKADAVLLRCNGTLLMNVSYGQLLGKLCSHITRLSTDTTIADHHFVNEVFP